MMDARYSRTGIHMKLSLISLAATLFVASACNAQSVVGCAHESGTTFQATPCLGEAMTIKTFVAVSAPPAAAEAQPDEVLAVAAPPPRALLSQTVIHSSGDKLRTGMSDLQVLNNRRWGKPQKITRNREDRAWHEHWRYETGANGGKQLHFINGMLVSIEDLKRPLQAPSMVSAVMIEGT